VLDSGRLETAGGTAEEFVRSEWIRAVAGYGRGKRIPPPLSEPPAM
jgi:hypothetical protein